MIDLGRKESSQGNTSCEDRRKMVCVLANKEISGEVLLPILILLPPFLVLPL